MVTLIRTILGGSIVTGGGVITMAFADPTGETEAQARVDDVEAFFTSLAAGSDAGVTFQVEGNPSRYAAATGELQQVFAAAGSAVIPGAVAGDAVPRGSQTLIRWATADIVNGRVVRGRTFLPGAPAVACGSDGQVKASWMDQVKGYADTLLDASGGTLVVWHRPVLGAGGSEHLVTVASVWDQFAMLTSRRD